MLPRSRPRFASRVGAGVAVAAATLLALTSCGGAGAARSTSTAASARPAAGGSPTQWPGTSLPAAPRTSTFDKVMIIPEENETETSVIGSSHAPYITKIAKTYGRASNMYAGYPVDCPSLAAYILMTSGSRHGICDDKGPATHVLTGDNVFQQVQTAGKEWRQYAESMTSNCQVANGAPGGYLVRHAPPPYYTSVHSQCLDWDEPMGTTTSGALHDDLAAGLPAFSIMTGNTCHEMHGSSTCRTDLVGRGDAWLESWLPQIIASPDFQAARLVVIVTWDEGSDESNHIPTLVLTRTTHGVVSSRSYTHCSTLRTVEQVLSLPYLGCAATANSYRKDFTF